MNALEVELVNDCTMTLQETAQVPQGEKNQDLAKARPRAQAPDRVVWQNDQPVKKVPMIGVDLGRVHLPDVAAGPQDPDLELQLHAVALAQALDLQVHAREAHIVAPTEVGEVEVRAVVAAEVADIDHGLDHLYRQEEGAAMLREVHTGAL